MSIEPQALDKKKSNLFIWNLVKGIHNIPGIFEWKKQNMINIYPAYRYINVNVVQIHVCTFACYKKMPREKKKLFK